MGMRRVHQFVLLVLCVTVIVSCRTPPQAEANQPLHHAATRDLSIDERRGGHTLSRHVGRTDQQLRERLEHERSISAASTYTDRQTAERAVQAAIQGGKQKIERWTERGER